MKAWITNPAHPHYPEYGVVLGTKLDKRGRIHMVTMVLDALVFHGVTIINVPAKDVQPVKEWT